MPKKFEETRKAIKRNLRKNHPDWSEDYLEDSSWTIATKFWKDKYGVSP